MGIVRVTLIAFSIASILVLAGFSTIFNEKAYAGGPTAPPFGDFVCWISVDPGLTAIAPLGIEDQFGSIENDVWEQIEYCTVADKDGVPSPFTLAGQNQHYQGWSYPLDTIGPGTGFTMQINVPQFGDNFITTLGVVDQILVPATKTLESGQVVPSSDSLQHWNCYLMSGPAPTAVVELVTQHGPIEQTTVLDPFLFCAPMIKIIPPEGPVFGQLLDEHMICYDIRSDLDFSTNLPVALSDQITLFFAQGPLPFIIDIISPEHPRGLEKLCVPAFKSFPAVGGTMVPIDTTSLLLAGVQSISMWMIPVVAAGVIIGIFVIKRRK